MAKISPEAAAQRRQHILDAARRCFATRGIRVSVSEICAEAGISKGAFYDYFASKDAAIEALAAAHRDALDSVADIVGIDPLVARLFEYAHAGDIASSRLELEAWTHALQQPALRAIFAENSGKLEAALARSLGSEGVIEPDDSARILLIFATGMIAVTALDTVNGDHSRDALTGLLRLVVEAPKSVKQQVDGRRKRKKRA